MSSRQWTIRHPSLALLTPALLPAVSSAPCTAASRPSNCCLDTTRLLLVPYVIVSRLVKYRIKAAITNGEWSVQEISPQASFS